MTLRIEIAQIRNLRNHPWQDVEALRRLLSAGAEVTPDPRRKNFYEVEGASQVYYIHVPPASSRVMFLAVWPKARAAAPEAGEESAVPAYASS